MRSDFLGSFCAPSKLEAKKEAEDSASEEERKFLAEEAAGKGGKSD